MRRVLNEEEEGRKPNMLSNPALPSRKEVDEHMATHIPYRSWCPHCVIGRGRNMQHFKKSMEEIAERGPQISADYGFLGADGEVEDESEKKGLTPILVMKDRGSTAVMAMAVPKKGEDPEWIPQRCARWIDDLGYGKIALKTDQEPSIRAWARAVAQKRTADTVPEVSPVGESQANGLAEQAVGEIKGMIKTLKHSLQENLKANLEPQHAVMTWLVEYAGLLLSRHKVRFNGKTAYENRRGKRASMPICQFGEKILYLPLKTVPHRKFQYGIFVGIQQKSNEVLVATEEGVVKARTLKRLPEEQKVVRGVRLGHQRNTVGTHRRRHGCTGTCGRLPAGPRTPSTSSRSRTGATTKEDEDHAGGLREARVDARVPRVLGHAAARHPAVAHQ